MNFFQNQLGRMQGREWRDGCGSFRAVKPVAHFPDGGFPFCGNKLAGRFDRGFFENFGRQRADSGRRGSGISSIEPLVEFGNDVLGSLEALPDGVLVIRIDGGDEFRGEAEVWRVGADGFLAPVTMHFQAPFGSSAVFAVFHKAKLSAGWNF